MNSSVLNDALNPQPRKTRYWDRLLNGSFALTVGLCVMVCALPIFSHELYVSPSTYDFGTVKAGAEVQHSFTLRNLHPWTVTVTGVRSDCGCTKAFVGKTVPFQLRPLQSVQIATSVSTTYKANDIKEAVIVFTDDNTMGTPLILQGRVQKKSRIHKEL